MDLTGIELQSSLDFLPRTGANFTLIDNYGPAPITGIFTGLPEGSILDINRKSFRLNYQSGPIR